MNEIRFEIEKKTIIRKTPEEWNELSLDQLLFVAPRVMFVNKSLRIKRDILYYFLKMKENNLQEMNQSQEDGLLASLDFLFKSPQLTKNLIPVIKIGKIKLIGPADEIKNITVSQFAFADKFMGDFLKTKEEKYLNLLLGTLYLERGNKFKKENVENIAKHINKLSLDKRLAMLAFFIGCRSKISEANKDIFKQGNKAKKGKTGWLGFFYELAGPKIGTYNDVADMNFFEMLGIMRKINEDAREATKQNKRRF